MVRLKYDEIISVDGNKLTKKYIESLSYEEREALILPIFIILKENGWIYPTDDSDIKKSYQKLVNYSPNIYTDIVFNNSSLATNICKFFCKSFYNATEKNKPTMIDVFNDDEKLKKIIRNRLGLDWMLDDIKNGVVRPGVNEAFNLSFRMIVQGIRSMRLVSQISIFKPDVAKFMAEKYSKQGDTIFDPSCGFGARMLGTVAAGRKYIGTDPMTVPELEIMAKFLNLKNYTLIQSGSENYKSDENSIDLSWSSPPYFDMEWYENNDRQAYAKGENYFYNIYWKQTLENIKYMLKPNKWFGLNILDKYNKMLDMTTEIFGEPIETVKLRTVRSHLTKSKGITKFEHIYMYRNIK